ncbi:hypothetical protein AUR64_09385 [Haloprofundus marisrubri]|uniref:Uncharacterized protein n=1 Tax=Haloprofundus marisrubri TaxID=1514971 RepID=A0A0W1R8R3_9EURY|nr:hypothetical protein [Haloprofundus marisrubri]KTG09832.1 hypothetical protein AUR64_09385 [Haloprofundus marisrubri]
MSMQTYTLQVEETETHDGISADVYDEDDIIAASTHVAYDDHGLKATGDGRSPETATETVTADVLSLDVQVERIDDRFEFRLLGDGEELARESVTNEEWRLDRIEE